MGLDMYFLRVPKGQKPNADSAEQIKYFRKHSDLHGWLEEEWRNQSEENRNADWNAFNCVYMEITPEILMRLKDYLTRPDKQHYEGFFWGASNDQDWEDTCNLIARIKDIIKSGDKVYYYSWW